MNEKPNVVIDTQVFLRAAVRRASLPGKVVFGMRESYRLLTSKATRAEVIDVLNRPKLRRKFSDLTDEVVAEINSILDEAVDIAVAEVPAVSRDPKDDIFLACAVDGKAGYIVTEDNDLLVLNPYQDIKIINVLEFWQVLFMVPVENPKAKDPLLVTIEGVFPVKGRGTIVSGKVESGTLKKGDLIQISGKHKPTVNTQVTAFEGFIRDPDSFVAVAGDRCGIVLRDVEAGQVEVGMIITVPDPNQTA